MPTSSGLENHTDVTVTQKLEKNMKLRVTIMFHHSHTGHTDTRNVWRDPKIKKILIFLRAT
jgi:hypothetical protein